MNDSNNNAPSIWIVGFLGVSLLLYIHFRRIVGCQKKIAKNDVLETEIRPIRKGDDEEKQLLFKTDSLETATNKSDGNERTSGGVDDGKSLRHRRGKIVGHTRFSMKDHRKKLETWERARHLFPGLLTGPNRKYKYTDPKIKVKNVLFDLLRDKVKELRKEDEGRFDELMKQENAVDLCLALGMNEQVVRKRYEAITNLKQEFNLTSKTPTLLCIRHLIRRIGLSDPYGTKEDMDGIIRNHYREKEWLSYLGVGVKRGNVANALGSVKDKLEQSEYTNSYMHGTSATAPQVIENNDGRIYTSAVDISRNGERHDFGRGFYCLKGEIQRALSLAIDRCWPIYDEGLFSSHNPAIILFPKPLQSKAWQVYEVGKRKPFKDADLKNRVLTEEEFQEFENSRKSWDEGDTNWKEFVKLARCYHELPGGTLAIYCGPMHHCCSTHKTDEGRDEPRKDDVPWVQYCFRNCLALGHDRLFVEFDVDWNQWTNDCPWHCCKDAHNVKVN